MKIKEIKFIHAVKLGSHELLSASNYPGAWNRPALDIELIEPLLLIVKLTDPKSKLSTYVPLSNVIGFTDVVDNVRPENTPNRSVQSNDKNRGRPIPKAK